MINSKKVLLLGGTGAMGVHLAQLLSNKGYQVTVTSRKNRNDYDNVHFVQGNAKDENFLNQILVDCSWDSIVDFMTYSTEQFQSRIDLLLGNTKQYVYLSSSRVYAECKGLISEDSPRLLDVCNDIHYLATDEYALYKAREEDILLKGFHNNYTIIRPYITYSKNRLPLGVLEKEVWARRALSGKTIVVPEILLSHITSLAYGEDVSKVIAELVCNPSANKNIFNITTDECVTWNEILDVYVNELKKITGKDVNVIKSGRIVSSWKTAIKNLLIDVMHFGRYEFSIKDYSIHYQFEYDRLFDRKFNNTKTNELVLSVKYQSYKDCLPMCLKEFACNPIYNHPVNWCKEAVYDRLAKEYTPLTNIQGLSNKLTYLLLRYIIPVKYIEYK